MQRFFKRFLSPHKTNTKHPTVNVRIHCRLLYYYFNAVIIDFNFIYYTRIDALKKLCCLISGLPMT